MAVAKSKPQRQSCHPFTLFRAGLSGSEGSFLATERFFASQPLAALHVRMTVQGECSSPRGFCRRFDPGGGQWYTEGPGCGLGTRSVEEGRYSVFIETVRLVLRTVTMDDVEDVALTWRLDDGPISRQEAEDRVRWMLDNHRQNAPGKVVHLCLAIIQRYPGAHRLVRPGPPASSQGRSGPVLFAEGKLLGEGIGDGGGQGGARVCFW